MSAADPRRALLFCDLAADEGLVGAADVASAIERCWPRRFDVPDLLAEQVVMIGGIPPVDIERLWARVDRLTRDAGGLIEALAARRGIAGEIHTALSRQAPQVSMQLVETGAPPRVPLRAMGPGRYVDFMPIGEGGMGLVFLALDRELNREVAIKLVRPAAEDGTPVSVEDPLGLRPPDGSARPRFDGQAARFLQEAWVTGRLEHPGIVPIHELGRTDAGVPYYTMRFIRGSRTLRDALTEATNSELEERMKLLEPYLRVCDAIAYAHEQGVLHRDLKPENVALGEFGEVVVLDWGLAALAPTQEGHDSATRPHLRGLGGQAETSAQAVGTPGYMAPEAAAACGADLSRASDVYGLGVMLFEVLTGQRPFAFWTFDEYVEQVTGGDAPRADAVRQDVPSALADLCACALERDPADRAATVESLAASIRAWQAQTQVDREVEGWLTEARDALTGAEGAAPREAVERLDRVLAACAMIERNRAHHPEAATLREEATLRREDAMRAREHVARRQVLRRALAVVVLLAGISATVVAAVLSQKNEALMASRARAEGLVHYLVSDVRAGLEEIGRLDLLDAVANRVMAHYENRLEDDGADLPPTERVSLARAMGVLADVLGQRGEPNAARKALDRARHLLAPVGSVQGRVLADTLLSQRSQLASPEGTASQVGEDLRGVVSRLTPLATSDEGGFEAAFQLGIAHRRLAKHHMANSESKAVESHLDAASAAFTRAQEVGIPPRRRVDLLRERAERCREAAAQGRRLGDAERDLRESEAAHVLLEEAHGLAPRDWRISEALVLTAVSMAGVDYEAGRHGATIERLRHVRPIAERLVDASPDSLRTRLLLSRLLVSESYALSATGRLGEAEVVLLRAVAVANAMVQSAPDAQRTRRMRAGVLHALGRTYHRSGQAQNAVEALRRSVQETNQLGEKHGWTAAILYNAAVAGHELADALRVSGQRDEEHRILAKLRSRLRPRLRRAPDDNRMGQLYVTVLRSHAAALFGRGDLDAAHASVDEALALARARFLVTGDVAWRIDEGEVLVTNATMLAAKDDFAGAIHALRQADQALAAVLDVRPEHRRCKLSRCEGHAVEAEVCQRLGQAHRAVDLLREAVRIDESVGVVTAEQILRGRERIRIRRALVVALERIGAFQEGHTVRQRVLAEVRAYAHARPRELSLQVEYAQAFAALGTTQMALERPAEAVASFTAARDALEQVAQQADGDPAWRAGTSAALAGLVRALAAHDKFDEARIALARLRAVPGATARADTLDAVLRAIERGSRTHGPNVTREVARTLAARGDHDRALRTYEKLLQLLAHETGASHRVDLRMAARQAAKLAAGSIGARREDALRRGHAHVRAERASWIAERQKLAGPTANLRAAGIQRWIQSLREDDESLEPLRVGKGFQDMFSD